MGKNKQKHKHKQKAAELENAKRREATLHVTPAGRPDPGTHTDPAREFNPQETHWATEPTTSPQETQWAAGSGRVVSDSQSTTPLTDADVAREWNLGDTILDLYEVTGVLGEGGMGKVYRVHHKNWNIDLAVKAPRPEIIDRAGAKENFVREAETWVNLGLHPHIVSCYYVRDLGGIPRVFAEYVEGGTLSDWIRTRRLYEGGPDEALERILDISIQFAWGLHYAHEQGLVHQDVKPANVMMTPDGVAKVTDFGLARARGLSSVDVSSVAGQSVLVESGGMTPAYASPEQVKGEPLTRKTDIWSWAVSVLEIFTGEVIWMSGSAAADVVEEFVGTSLDDASIPEIPEAVRDLLLDCFKYSPSERPQDMMEVANHLQEIYHEITGRTFARQLPKAGKVIAASLNNRAVSFLDLGKQAEALSLWDEALRVESHHPEATFNRGLVLWRAARLGDDAFIGDMEEVRTSHENSWTSDYLRGLVHLERGDSEAAIKALESIQDIDANIREVRAALTVAKERVPHSKQLEGHTDSVKSVSLTADGKYALSGSRDKTLKLWEVATGRCLRTFEGHEGSVDSISLSADGKYALSGSDDNTLKLWEVATGQCLRNFEGHAKLMYSVSLSADGKYALSGSLDDTLKLWEVATGRCLRTFEGHTERVFSVTLSADGKYALSGSWDKTLKLWDVATGRCLRTFEGHTHDVMSVSLSADCKYALSGNGGLKLWDVATGQCLRTFEGHAFSVSSASLSADGKYALSGGWDNKLKLWEVATGRCLRTFEGQTDWVSSVSLSADGKYALSGSGDKTLKLWEVQFEYVAPIAISQIVASEVATQTEEAFGKSVALAREAFAIADPVTAANHIKQARSLIGCERIPEAVELWAELYMHLPRRALNGGWGKRTLEGHTDSVNSVSLSRDGKYALSGSGDNTLKLWEVATGRCVRTFEGHGGSVDSVSLSADGKYALSGSLDNTLKLWDVATGRCLRTFKGDVKSVSLSADGKYALSGNGGLNLWDVAAGRCLRTFKGNGRSISLSADGKYALSGSDDKTLKLWEVATGQCLRTFEGHGHSVRSVGLSADGKYALSGSDDKTLKLWEVATGQCLRTFEGHGHSVWSVSFSADGKYALSGSRDKTLKLWEVATGGCLRTFEGHEGWVYSVSLSADGKYALSGSGDKTLKLWMLDWELEDRQAADWDEGAREYLHIFSIQHTPYAYSLPENRRPSREEVTMALTRQGKPTWSEGDFQQLLHTLGCVGYGWLRPEGVRRELERMSADYPRPTRELREQGDTGTGAIELQGRYAELRHGLFEFCTRCGTPVQPYRCNEFLDHDAWSYDERLPSDANTEETNSGYWCWKCQTFWRAFGIGDPGRIWPCGHFMPFYVAICAVCGPQPVADSNDTDLTEIPYRCVDCGNLIPIQISSTEQRSALDTGHEESCSQCGQVVGSGTVNCRMCDTRFVLFHGHAHVGCDVAGGTCPNCDQRYVSLCIC